jgi:hypothetical protein
VRGFWEEEHFDEFVRELHLAIASFPQSGKPPKTLYNYTHAWNQPQAVVTKMRALAQHPAMIDCKVAMYTEGVLAHQQAKRVAEGRDNMQVFDCRADALAFLCSDAPWKMANLLRRTAATAPRMQ